VLDNFFELGGHSILAVKLLFKMQEIYKVDLSLQTLFERPTVEAQAEAIEQIVNSSIPSIGKRINLAAEATLDSSITPTPIRLEYNVDPSAIFLTGATGFLGAFLLHELLERTQAKV
jgi:dTDP-D-glucose 4,6-dehydratase